MRPLSPHLGIYRIQSHAVLSILHRLTGLALMLFPAAVLVWLWALAAGETTYRQVQTFWVTPLGQAGCYLLALAAVYHLVNGVRHILWDVGYLPLTRQSVRVSGGIVLAVTMVLAILVLCT